MNAKKLVQVRNHIDDTISALYQAESLLHLAFRAIPDTAMPDEVDHCKNGIRAIAAMIEAQATALDVRVSTALGELIRESNGELL